MLVCALNPFCVTGGNVERSTDVCFIKFHYSNSS